MWVKLLDSEALPDGEMAPAQYEDVSVALYRIEGVVHATANVCTHQYALMTDGYFDGAMIECPLHQALFDVKTGEAIEGPVNTPLRCYPVDERADGIYVEIV